MEGHLASGKLQAYIICPMALLLVTSRDVKASKPDWPGAKNLASASASKLSGLGLDVLASVSRHSGHYRTPSQLPKPGTDEPSKQLLRYITYINSHTSDHSSSELAKLYCDFSVLYSPCLIDCFASRQALLQSREFSHRAVLLCQLAGTHV